LFCLLYFAVDEFPPVRANAKNLPGLAEIQAAGISDLAGLGWGERPIFPAQFYQNSG
jgi:hypothetical protein